jgi:hypothetical protein
MIKFTSFQSLAEGAKLTPAELIKPNSSTGEDRIDILLRLIKSNKPLELSKGGTFIVTDIDHAIAGIEAFKKDNSERKKPIALKGDNESFITTSDLAKAKVFGGGGGGAGGGSANTKNTESHQCVMIQAMLDHGIQSEEYFNNDDIIKTAYKKVKVDATLDEVLSVGDDWFHSSYESAVLLIKNGYVNKSQTFHRGDKIMAQIYAKKTIAFKNSGFSPLKDDKWNPGDIWAVAKGFDVKKELGDDSVKTLNEDILQHFLEKRLVGISLKKVKKKAKHVEMNIQRPPDVADHKLSKILLQGEKRGDFWSSKGATIVFDSGSIIMKDNAAGAAVKAELKGKTARGGGAGWGVMVDAMKQVFRKSPVSDKFKSDVFATAKKIAKGDKKSIEKFWKMYSHFYSNDSYENFLVELKKKDQFWISAKYGCMIICYMVSLNTGTKANRFITKIVNYAGSKAEDSSAYVKVYE